MCDSTVKLMILENRLAILENNGKNIKSPGVVRKLKRQIRALKQAD